MKDQQMSTGRDENVITVLAISACAAQGRLRYGPLDFPCALGRSGRRWRKVEGDGASPSGTWPLRYGFFRADRLLRPRTHLPMLPLQRHHGWCDDAMDRNYNRLVRLPYKARAEEMWRQDALYDLVVILGHNERPRCRGRGSAIFIHVARSDYGASEGCIALARPHLVRLLEALRPGAVLRIGV